MEIEDGIPAPAKRRNWPFRHVAPGQSVLIPEGELPLGEQAAIGARCAVVFGKGNYRTKRTPEGVRVWRLA